MVCPSLLAAAVTATFRKMMDSLRALLYWLAIGMGVGRAPWAPGTAGTLLAVPLVWGLWQLSPGWQWTLVVAALVAGIPICAEGSRRLGRHDPGAVVWDEMAAFGVLGLVIPRSLPWLAAAFVLFRLFDIAKPWPIRDLDHRMGGGLGIMLDDLLAAGYAAVCLALLGRMVAAV
jgi:phosphatidylglycerophosphatase A